MVITSNRTRELHDALKRRCLYHWIDHPDLERELAIIGVRAPEVPERAGPPGGRRRGPAPRRSTSTSPRAWPRRSTGPTPWPSSASTDRRRGRGGDARPVLKDHDDPSWPGPTSASRRRRGLSGRRPCPSRRPLLRSAGRIRPLLRRQGLPVGTGRVLSFCRAAAPLDPFDPVDLRLAARATLVSRPEDFAAWTRVRPLLPGRDRLPTACRRPDERVRAACPRARRVSDDDEGATVATLVGAACGREEEPEGESGHPDRRQRRGSAAAARTSPS